MSYLYIVLIYHNGKYAKISASKVAKIKEGKIQKKIVMDIPIITNGSGDLVFSYLNILFPALKQKFVILQR